MRGTLILISLLALLGCAPIQPLCPPAVHPNPALIPISNQEFVWNRVVDVVDDYFEVDREEPVKLVGDVLTEGFLETRPQPGATYLEPWRDDSVGSFNRLQSTLQSIRRRAVVRVIPEQGGFLVEVTVFKELEDLPKPVHESAGDATFRYDNSIQRYREPVGEVVPTVGWIPLGRDTALEQRILGQLLGTAPY